MNKNQVIVPHILILDEDNLHKFNHQNLMPVIIMITKLLKEDDDLKNGMAAVSFENDSVEDEIALSWYTNYYQFNVTTKFGEAHSEDKDKIKEQLIKHLLSVSLDLSVNDADELMAEFDEGTVNIKFGKGKDKRIYKVYYQLTHSNLENALEQIEESIALVEKEIKDDDLSPKRILH